MTNEQIEERVRELFERQAGAVAVQERIWDEPVATVTELEPRRRRWTGAAIAASVTAGVAVLALVAFGVNGDGSVRTNGPAQQPGGQALQYASHQVTLAADTITFIANGQAFSPAGQAVSVHGDPGDGRHQSLELEWTERGVPQRLYVYFESDATNWWVSELRTRNGQPEATADWINYRDDDIRAPLETAWTGDVDLSPIAGDGHLTMKNVSLLPFLAPSGCKTATTPYIVNVPAGTLIDFQAGPANGYGLQMELLDTKTCAPVDGATFTFTAEEPLHIDGRDDTSVQLSADTPGVGTIRADARLTNGGPVVAGIEVKVAVTEPDPNDRPVPGNAPEPESPANKTQNAESTP